MTSIPLRASAVTLAAMLVLSSAPAAEQSPTYVQFQPYAVKGAVYRPDGDGRDIGVLAIHRVNNYLNHIAGAELAKRGFPVLTMNSRFDNNETSVQWEAIALDVKTGVEYMRKTMGVRRVILFGHSGGGPTLSFYQAVAEQGPAYCNTPGRIVTCGAAFPVLPKADAMIFVDAGLGQPIGLLRGLHPGVGKDDDPAITRPDLDPYNPANGFKPDGTTKFSEAFVRTYHEAQSARMNRLIADASARAAQLGPGGNARFPDDDVVFIARSNGGNLANIDRSLDTSSSLKQPRKIVKITGRTVNERVQNQQPDSAPSRAPVATFAGSRLLTLRSFLTTNAIRSTNSRDGIDWCSSNSSTPCAVQKISVPLLVTAMQGGSPIGDAEFIYETAASKDKDFAVFEGASHNIIPCTECEQRKGEYDNTVKVFFDYVNRWIDARF